MALGKNLSDSRFNATRLNGEAGERTLQLAPFSDPLRNDSTLFRVIMPGLERTPRRLWFGQEFQSLHFST